MKEPTAAELSQQLIEALGKAAGASGQLIHTHGSPGFFFIRKSLEVTKEGVTKWAMGQYSKMALLRPKK